MSEKKVAIPENVNDFIYRCSNINGDFSKSNFLINTWEIIKRFELTSPIEQLLYSALSIIIKTNYIDMVNYYTKEYVNSGIIILPQYKVGNYRIDFLIVYYDPIGTEKRELLVECDSQQFHDRTEQERRYEKMRERFLVSKGYKIFRYTGKEITDNPFDIAIEIISYLTNLSTEDLSYFKDFDIEN